MIDKTESQCICKGIEDSLQYAGSNSRFQFILLLVMSLLMIPASYPITIIYFISFNSPWKCATNSSYCKWNGTMPSDNTQMCKIPDGEWYFTEPQENSITTQFNLNCKGQWIVYSIWASIYFGWIAGSLVIGLIADRYGRKIAIFPSVAGVIVTGLVIAFSPNFIVFAVFFCIMGFCMPGAFFIPFVLLSELMIDKYRIISINLLHSVFSVATCILCLKAYLIRQWKLLLIACFAPYTFVILFAYFVPESFLWVHLNGNKNDILKLVQKIAHWNKRVLPADFSISSPSNRLLKTRLIFHDLFRSSKKTFILGWAWSVQVIVLFLLSKATYEVSDSKYLQRCIAHLLDIPAYLAAIYFCEKLGRRLTIFVCTVLSSACCIIIAFISTHHPVFIVMICRVGCAMIGKFFNTINTSALSYWTLELYPTNLRARAIGYLQMSAVITIPFFPLMSNEMEKLYGGAPYLIMGIVSFANGSFLLKLEEIEGTTMENASNDIVKKKGINIDSQ